MFTHEQDVEPRGWHRPRSVRIALVVGGLVALLVGGFMWTLEQEYGGWEGTGLGHHVIAFDESGRTTVSTEDGSTHEFASVEEAEAWIEDQRDRDFTASIVVVVVGGLSLVVGLAPSPVEGP